MGRALPDLTSRIVIDSSGLAKAESAAKGHGQGIGNALKPAEAGAAKTESAFAGLTKRLEGMGPAGSQAGGILRELEGTAGGLGATLGGGLALGATAAVAALGALAVKGVEDYVALAEQVRAYSRISGEGAEESSRMVGVFSALGVNSEAAAKGMFQLGKRASETPDKLRAVGIEIDRNNEGGINLQATFLNVVDAYQRAGTGAERDAIAFASFGKAGMALIPILAENRAELQKLADEQATVFTQEDLNRAHEASVQMNLLGQNVHALSINVGELVSGPLIAQASQVNDAFVGTRAFNQALKEGKNVIEANAAAVAAITASHVDLSSAQKKLAGDIEETTKRLQAEAKATDALNKALDSLLGVNISSAKAMLNVGDAAVALSKAAFSAGDAALKTADAQKAYNDAVAWYGQNSPQAVAAHEALAKAQLDEKLASEDVTKAQLEQEAAIDQAAKAAQKEAETNAEAAGSALTSTQSHQVYINKLKELVSHLTGPVADALNAMIAKEEAAGTDRTATINIKFNVFDPAGYGNLVAAGGAGFTRAAGGRVVPGSIYKVGEEGSEWFMPDAPGRILPHGQSPAMPAAAAPATSGGSGSPTTTVIEINAPIILDDREVGRFVKRVVARDGRGQG